MTESFIAIFGAWAAVIAAILQHVGVGQKKPPHTLSEILMASMRQSMTVEKDLSVSSAADLLIANDFVELRYQRLAHCAGHRLELEIIGFHKVDGRHAHLSITAEDGHVAQWTADRRTLSQEPLRRIPPAAINTAEKIFARVRQTVQEIYS